MTGPGAGSGGSDRNKKSDLGGADAVPGTPQTAKPQGAGLTDEERRRTPRATPTASAGSGMKPIIYIVAAIAVIALAYFLFTR
jgi:hypothetical protein